MKERVVEVISRTAPVYNFPDAMKNFYNSTKFIQWNKMHPYAKDSRFSLYEVFYTYPNDDVLVHGYGYYLTNETDYFLNEIVK